MIPECLCDSCKDCIKPAVPREGLCWDCLQPFCESCGEHSTDVNDGLCARCILPICEVCGEHFDDPQRECRYCTACGDPLTEFAQRGVSSEWWCITCDTNIPGDALALDTVCAFCLRKDVGNDVGLPGDLET